MGSVQATAQNPFLLLGLLAASPEPTAACDYRTKQCPEKDAVSTGLWQLAGLGVGHLHDHEFAGAFGLDKRATAAYHRDGVLLSLLVN